MKEFRKFHPGITMKKTPNSNTYKTSILINADMHLRDLKV